MKIKRIFAAIISTVIFLSFFACGNKNDDSTHAEFLKSEAVKLIEWYKTEKVGKEADISDLAAATDDVWSGRVLSNSDITVVGAACYYGAEGDYDAYFAKLEAAFNEIYADKETVKTASPAALYTLIRTLSLMNKNPSDFCGVDLISAATTRNESYKSVYSTPYILTVLDEYGLRESEKQLANSTIEWLLSQQHDDGGWGYEDYESGEKVTDPDATAMVLAGLAPFVSENDKNISKAWECLDGFKTDSGAYKSRYSDGSSDTTVEVLTAVVAAGKNPFEDGNFITGGKNLIDVVLSFKNEDGGLRAGLDEAPSDCYSVQNALDAFYRASQYLSAERTNTFNVYLSVSCRIVFSAENYVLLDGGVKEILPQDGIIFANTSVVAKEKQTVYELLVSVMRENKIHCEGGQGYIKGINNLYEKQCGAESGWVFFINGEFSSAGANAIYVKANDKIEWAYSVKKGDVNGGNAY